MNESSYFRQVELLLRVLPLLTKEKDFALKGGTAINFFHRDMPRLSIDIDLTYLPVSDRKQALQEISNGVTRLAERAQAALPGTKVSFKKSDSDMISSLVLRRDTATIKIEANTVIRGSVYPPENRKLSPAAQKRFAMSLTCQTLAFADLYGGKLCATLDRQHPRDLFDINLLLKSEGLTTDIRKAFLVYLISHNRPISELLQPRLLDIKDSFEKEFQGMTTQSVSLKDLLNTRVVLFKKMQSWLTEKERQFLLSFKQKQPDWKLLGLKQIEYMPAVKWKLENLDKMKPERHQQAVLSSNVYSIYRRNLQAYDWPDNVHDLYNKEKARRYRERKR